MQVKVKIKLICPNCGNQDAQYVKQMSTNAEKPDYVCNECEYTIDRQLEEESKFDCI